jgi:hypothetical protein
MVLQNASKFIVKTIMAVFKDVEIAICTEDATVLQISFKNPKSLDFDIADIMKNLCHADVQVAG